MNRSKSWEAFQALLLFQFKTTDSIDQLNMASFHRRTTLAKK